MTLPENHGVRRFVWPAEYYSRPTPEAVVPRWAIAGCGAASALALAGIFALGIVLSGGGFTTFMDFAIGMSLGEMRGQFTAEVSAGEKQALESEIERMRASLREERVSVTALQPFLDTLRKASSDAKITPAEVRALRKAAQDVEKSAKR